LTSIESVLSTDSCFKKTSNCVLSASTALHLKTIAAFIIHHCTYLLYRMMFRITNIALAAALMSASTSAFAPASFGVSRNLVSNTNIAAPAFNTNNMQLFMSDEEAVSAASSKLVRNPESNVEITLTAPGAATQAAYDKACAEVSKTISIPGFRKGAKIPPAVIENVLAAKGGKKHVLKAQAIQALLNSLLETAMKEEHNLEPIGQPSLMGSADDLADVFIPGEPLEMVVSCDVWPDIAWKSIEGQEKPYFGLKAAYSRKPFNQARLEQAMKDLAERYAITTAAPDGKELEMGDACIVDMQGYMAAEDGTSKAEPLPDAASGDDVEIVLGDGRYMTGLVEGLVGAKVGETKTVYVSFPVGLRDKTLAGKSAVFDVTVKEASTRTVPEIDDELANTIRPGLDAEGLKDEVGFMDISFSLPLNHCKLTNLLYYSSLHFISTASQSCR
jgi:trigger factor